MGMRTKIKNRIHAELVKRRIKLGVDQRTKKGRMMLESLGLEGVDQVLPILYALDRQIAVMSRDLRRMCGENPQAMLLTSIPGVGYYVASLWLRSVT